ncbi:MAG: hypothetical protein WEB06_13980 [Actinomycetota bacterium]
MNPSEAWALDEGFRVLAYAFRIRTTSPTCAELVLQAVGSCRSPDVPDDAPTFHLEDGGELSRLTLDDALLLKNAKRGNAFARLVWHIMNNAVAEARHVLVVHAGVVVAPDGNAVVLPATSGGGKTTLTAGLVRAGFDFLSDEMMAIDPVSLRVLPVPRSLFMKPGTFEALGVQPPDVSEAARLLLDGTWPVTPDDLRPGSLGGPAPVRTVIAPTYRPGSETRIERVSRAAGLSDLAGQAFNLEMFGGAAGIELLAEVVRPASCYRLAVGRLDEAVAAVSEAAAAPA